MAEDQGKRRRPPYATIAQIEALFERIGRMGDPGTVDKAWVENYKLAPTQPQAIVALLRWLGVIDGDGKSVGIWDDLRIPATRDAKLEELVRASYKEVFDLIDVSQATREDLEGTFIQAYKSGDPGRPVTCFIGLCKQAGIPMTADARSQKADDGALPAKKVKKAEKKEPKRETAASKQKQSAGAGRDGKQKQAVTISVNVEIPAEWSEEQIRERLEAVRRATSESTEE